MPPAPSSAAPFRMTTSIPFIPDNAPFSTEQRQWLNGFLAGWLSDSNLGSAIPPSSPSAPPKPIGILYGSQTGTAEGLARKAVAEAKRRGFAPQAVSMEDYAKLDLLSLSELLVITSTYGDGEPPDNAQAFWTYLKSDQAPALGHLRYSVLALGDTNYAAFCEFGRQCDLQLEALGAIRIHPRTDCDVDCEAPAKAWTEGVFAALGNGEPSVGLQALAPAPEPEGYSKTRPFPAHLLANRLLNATGSAKEVRHYEISLEGSGLSYEVGDALGVLGSNCADLVSELIAAIGCENNEPVPRPSGVETTLHDALLHDYDISKPSQDLLAAIAAQNSSGTLAALLSADRRDQLKDYLWGRDIRDLVDGIRLSAKDLVALLKRLQPRLYSISSSPKANPGAVHLTVAAVRYDAHSRNRKGVCSTFLAERAGDATPVPVFVQTSHGFRLPTDPMTPIIMVGPGTGIAPFRAFLQERRAVGAPGKNWLFFGDQKRSTDFLYQEELEAMQADGHLHRLDLAFSRDQDQKIYVQDRMRENADALWQWLQDGAHFYVCGDASRMAKDVDVALHEIAQTRGGLSPEAAAEYIASLKTQKRYQRDVY